MKKTKKNKQNKKKKQIQIFRDIKPKALAKTRYDVMTWKNALSLARNIDSPKMFPYYNLVSDVMLDAHATSQVQNRRLKTLSSKFSIKTSDGSLHEDATQQLQKSVWFNKIIQYMIDSVFFGYTLIELNTDADNNVSVSLIPRQNVIPQKGIVVKDYTEDKGIDYINAKEYGTWLLDFGHDLGLVNKAIPHILFSRFAQSCWPELCEIYGIPPRVMRTNTQNPSALQRAERMMSDLGAAAWFIIDETENLEFAQSGSQVTGQVYEGLIKLCRDNISLLFSGAIIGQDTKHGSRAKEQNSQDVLQNLVNADREMVEQYMNQKVLPALFSIGVLPQDNLTFVYDQVEDIDELWTRTKEILPYKKINDEWIKNKFGIEVEGDNTPQKNNFSLDFFD